MDETGFRHELKYVCSDAELAMLEIRLRTLLRPDRHANDAGTYLIRSIYFDDAENTCYRDNEDGVSPRSKWRIRCYERDRTHLFLECKQRESGMVKKSTCSLTLTQFEALLDTGNGLHVSDRHPALLNRFLLLKQNRLFAPKVIVQYERRPLIYREGNVRVTFDRNIASSVSFNRFFERELPLRPVLPAGRQLLEVKYDEFLPDAVYHAVQLSSMRQETFSKYYLCRRYALQ